VFGVILVVLNDLSQAEARDLDLVVLPHQDVPGRQISVDALLTLQVRHAARDLRHKQREIIIQVSYAARDLK
jgi:hypothetical protein